MSAFGALPIDAREIRFDALAASANKCLEGVPGIGFVIAREAALAECEGNAPALSLDLHDQWRAMERTGQWRLPPPAPRGAAVSAPLAQHKREGGPPRRAARCRPTRRTR